MALRGAPGEPRTLAAAHRAPLELLARAPDKQTVAAMLQAAFAKWTHRTMAESKEEERKVREDLALGEGEGAETHAKALLKGLAALVDAVVGNGASVADVLPGDGSFHPDLRKLLCKLVEKALPGWRAAAAEAAAAGDARYAAQMSRLCPCVSAKFRSAS